MKHMWNLFYFLKIENAINSISDYLIDHLIKEDYILNSNTQIESFYSAENSLINSLSIFPYRSSEIDNYYFWIIASYSNGNLEHYYVRQVIQKSETFKFIKILLNSQKGDALNFPETSTVRSELSLTKQLAKVFFAKETGKRIVFRGFQVFINDIPENIDLNKLQEQLDKLNKQQEIPKFPLNDYQQFIKTHHFKT